MTTFTHEEVFTHEVFVTVCEGEEEERRVEVEKDGGEIAKYTTGREGRGYRKDDIARGWGMFDDGSGDEERDGVDIISFPSFHPKSLVL